MKYDDTQERVKNSAAGQTKSGIGKTDQPSKLYNKLLPSFGKEDVPGAHIGKRCFIFLTTAQDFDESKPGLLLIDTNF